VIGQTAPRHTSPEFVSFLREVIATQPEEREVHIILDKFATHKTELVKDLLKTHVKVKLHFTPTYSSWLNQVESWFSKLQRDIIYDIFGCIKKSAKPFRWKYSDPRKRIPAW